jgi:predicted PhzF superfamily epimerase YddE/YHI9
MAGARVHRWFADCYNDAAIIKVGYEAAVLAMNSDSAALNKFRPMTVATARGREQDIASRAFVPYLGIDGGTASGSPHAALVLYWTKKLGRSDFMAHRASSRTGTLHYRQEGGGAGLGRHCLTLIAGQLQH